MRQPRAVATLVVLLAACSQTRPSSAPRGDRGPAPGAVARAAEPAPTNLIATTGFGCVHDCSGGVGTVLAAALRERALAARSCYENALKRNPTLKGRLVVGLQLADDGSVCASRLVKNTLQEPDVVSCIQGLFVGRRFPAPAGGCVNVALPLVFAPRSIDGGAPDASPGAAGHRDAGAR